MSATLRRLAVVFLLVAVHTNPIRAAEADEVSLPVDRLVGTRVGDFRLPDVVSGDEVWFYGLARANGFLGRVMGLKAVRAAVLVFVSPGCPLGEKYLPRLGELATRYDDDGIRFFAVASGAGETPEKLAGWARERGLSFPLLHDAGNVVADAVMVERSNECIVVDARGIMRYRGAIDDQHGYDSSLPEPRHTWLADAIDAVLAAAPQRIGPRGTPVAGCRLTRLQPRRSAVVDLDRVRPANSDIAAWLDEHEPAPPIDGAVSWNADIAPIMQAKCQSCHRPGQVGGFSLLTYEDAYRQSAMIAEVVENRRMPPWHADPRHGRFVNDRRLSATDRAKVLAWVAADAPRGEGVAPAPRAFIDGWTIGRPDVVIEIPAANPVPAQGTMPYVNVSVPTTFTEDVWVQAAHPVRSQVPVLRPTRLLSFMPHMHLRGKSFRYTLEEVGSKPEVLLDVPAFDFGWQSHYMLAKPRDLNLGARIVCDAVFDNSPANRANPDPTKSVTWGEQTWEEMMIGYIDIDFPRSDLPTPKP